PVVVLPGGADQPWNADRCAATGVGRVLDAASATPHEIAAAVSSVLAEPAYRTAAERLRLELSSFAPPSAAVALLEGCVQAKRVAFSSMSRPLPSGTVTFVFTDIEGSTRLLQELGEAYAAVSRDHRQLVRAAFLAHDGTEIDTQGDSFFFSFTRARDAVAAAVEAQ